MNCDQIIEWLTARQDIVIADKDKFAADFKAFMGENGEQETILDCAKRFATHMRENHISEDSDHSLLMIVGDGENWMMAQQGVGYNIASGIAHAMLGNKDFVKAVHVATQTIELYQTFHGEQAEGFLDFFKKLMGHDDE